MSSSTSSSPASVASSTNLPKDDLQDDRTTGEEFFGKLFPRGTAAAMTFQLLRDFFEGEAKERVSAAERALRFIRAHAGLTFRMPEADVTERAAEDACIFRLIHRDPSPTGVARAADRYGRSVREIGKIYSRMAGEGISVARAANSNP